MAGGDLARYNREIYRLHTVIGILFNHESERRGFEFVTRKISSTVARIARGLSDELVLGNLDARRDWGYAPDYVRAMWMMMQQDSPDDFVIASGVSHTVREFVDNAFEVVGLQADRYVKMDSRLFRPGETNELRGNASKAHTRLGWEPVLTLDGIIERMLEADLRRLPNL